MLHTQHAIEDPRAGDIQNLRLNVAKLTPEARVRQLLELVRINDDSIVGFQSFVARLVSLVADIEQEGVEALLRRD